MEAVSLKTSPIQSNRGFTAVQDEMPGDGEEDDLMYQDGLIFGSGVCEGL